jgi:hypothetical protein
LIIVFLIIFKAKYDFTLKSVVQMSIFTQI